MSDVWGALVLFADGVSITKTKISHLELDMVLLVGAQIFLLNSQSRVEAKAFVFEIVNRPYNIFTKYYRTTQ